MRLNNLTNNVDMFLVEKEYYKGSWWIHEGKRTSIYRVEGSVAR